MNELVVEQTQYATGERWLSIHSSDPSAVEGAVECTSYRDGTGSGSGDRSDSLLTTTVMVTREPKIP